MKNIIYENDSRSVLSRSESVVRSNEKGVNVRTIDFHEYGSRLDKLNTEFSHKLLALSLSDTQVASSQKKIQTRFGKIELNKSHAYIAVLICKSIMYLRVKVRYMVKVMNC